MGWQSKGEFLNGYATQSWVGSQGYMKSLPYRLNNYQSSDTSSSDPNNATESGFYYINGSTNRPPFSQSTNMDYRVLTTAYSDQWLQQIATDFRCTDVFIRRRENGTWTAWKKLGYADEHVKKSGDTMSGALTVNNNIAASGTVTVGNKATMQYNTTNECLNFTFA